MDSVVGNIKLGADPYGDLAARGQAGGDINSTFGLETSFHTTLAEDQAAAFQPGLGMRTASPITTNLSGVKEYALALPGGVPQAAPQDDLLPKLLFIAGVAVVVYVIFKRSK